MMHRSDRRATTSFGSAPYSNEASVTGTAHAEIIRGLRESLEN